LTGEVSAKAKVPQFQFIVGVYENIGWLQVPVHHPLIQKMLESTRDLHRILPNFQLWNITIGLPLTAYKFFQISVLGPFDGDKHFVVLDEALNVPSDVLMLQFFHQLHLLDAIVPLLHIVHVEYFEELQSYELTGPHIFGLEHKGEFALTDWLHYAVVSIHTPQKIAITNGLHFTILLLLLLHYNNI
jgi:hypothetical protein